MNDFTINELEEALHYIEVLSKNGSMFQPEIRKALSVAYGVLDSELSDSEHMRDRIGP